MQKTAHLLLVEDDDVDVMGIKRALRQLKISNPLHIAKDGIDALEILRGENGQEKLDGPCIVLLDLNMPRMGGMEFLEVVRGDVELKKLIIFVMSTSSDEQDIFAAYDKNIAGYILKSNAEETFLQALKLLEHFWRIVELPEASPHES